MRFAKLIAALAACSLAATPALAAPQASFWEAELTRAATPAGEANMQDGSASPYVIAFFVVVAISLGIYVAANNDDEGPTSP